MVESEGFYFSSRRCGWMIGIDFDFLFDLVVFTSAVFEFYIGTFIISFSTIVEGKLLPLPVIALTFRTRLCFHRFRKSWASGLAAAGSLFLPAV